MVFTSFHFLLFFPIVVAAYFIMPERFRQYWLLVASYYFYMSWNAKYAILILCSTFLTYICGIILENHKQGSDKGIHPKAALAMCISINLLILFVFKYLNFAVESVADIMGSVGIAINAPHFDIILPVGISFYTFQALGYAIDVYRGDIKAERNFFKYALFVSFFPQLVAGPIERSGNLLHQLDKPKRFETDSFREGFLLMLWGFFMKLVLADRIAIVVDTVYGDIPSYPGLFLFMATGLFAIQIYCDFAGYSTIARGAARILGIELMENFNAPYLSETVTQFWRNWHISLTSWFRDYVYIPLGGNRKGPVRKQINRMIVFLLSGLWHGANITYVIWGGLNGLYQVIGDMIKPIKTRITGGIDNRVIKFIIRWISIGITFALVSFAWIFFRAKSVSDAFLVIKLMFSTFNPEIIFTGKIYNLGVEADSFRMMAFCCLVLLIADVIKSKGIVIRQWIMNRRIIERVAMTTFVIMFILIFGAWGPAFNAANFIYFQF